MNYRLYLFCATLASFIPAATLCLLTVRDCLRYSLSRCLLALVGMTLAYALLDAAIARDAFEYAGVVVYLFLAYLLFTRYVQLSNQKLRFILMMVVSYYCFVVGMSWPLGIPADYTYALYCLCAAFFPGIPVSLFLYHVLWPMVRDIEGTFWRYLWIVPLSFSIVLTLLTQTMASLAPSIYSLILCVSFLAGFCVYFVLLSTLTEATRQVREAERAQAAASYMALQADQYELLTQNIESSRMIRHDMRHQLLVIKGYAQAGDTENAVRYCDALAGAIPTDNELIFCDNFAVNAVVAHYVAQGRAAGVAMEIELNIAKNTAPIEERDLSVIIGNLLENAIEANKKLPADQRWLRIRARLISGKLTIVMDNHFDGTFLRSGHSALSRKHDGTGIGLSSIQAVAKKYGGDTAFETREDLFLSSVYLPILPVSSDG